ncbi:hypothetical protein CRG98_022273, partial [Punica granatum]
MHPFCCTSTVSENKSSPTLSPQFAMPATAQPHAGRSNPPAQFANHVQNHNHQNSNNDNNLPSHRSTAPLATVQSAREQPAIDVKLNEIVGNGIAGVLYKWVNYGKGWRPRWFVLQDGVLSYYKIHGPDKIVVDQEMVKGSKIIGEESMRRISRFSNGQSQNRRQPLGEIHLKVSSIRESKSDDKRFSIFTGMKRLHLRAESREDRVAWMEALQAVKDMFPRMSNSELMAPIQNITMSTEKLRERLQQEGVREATIQESEQIMKNEFSAMQQQLMLLKQKQWQLIDTLRQLETEKVDLENTVVDESQRQCNDQGTSALRREKDSEASASGSEDERVDIAEEETDDEDHTFFDTRDFLSSSSFKSNGSDYRRSSFSSDDEGLNA